jgi:cytochrome c2
MNTAELIEKYERAELGIDGNCGFALLGPDIQEGEAEFVEILPVNRATLPKTRHEEFTGEVESGRKLGEKLRACQTAMENLRNRLGAPSLSYYLGRSHPYGD